MYSVSVKPMEIDIWTAFASATDGETRCLYETLSADEQSRAERFRSGAHKDYFTVGRGLLRRILGRYLRMPAKDISFRYGSNGKPSLDNVELPLHFNLAHSQGLVAYAVSPTCELGLDIEFIRPLPGLESIASKFFAAAEYSQLISVPANERVKAFFNCWTRKEAYLKALGCGLSAPLDRFQVSLIPGEPACFLRLGDDEYPVSQWTLLNLTLSPEYVGAIAAPLPDCTVQQRSFPDISHCLTYLEKNNL